MSTRKPKPPHQIRPLRGYIEETVDRYLEALDGHKPGDLHKMVIRETEHALLTSVLKSTQGNQSRAAEILNMNRGTLRKKIKLYKIAT